ncbi:acyl-CoA dehydrogenase [Geomicrobium sp. JCM 19039]|uniref:acyl-CoA dehydrogenase n=1 Tax=Geomicrobium sp. JCM 19039 TaxID=1460636 RepID=UPI00045F4076|nr:acyl-CoA dehydrogenase [Geomicrobium sp. JCM 19039]GAK12124.1 butyryl-CoA dehydrogenase [Geomicrobium sp. JCM 19039]
MNLNPNEQEEMLRHVVRKFAENEVQSWVPSMEKDEFPYGLVEQMGELGLMGIPVPEEYGGSEMGFVAYIATIHELSKISASTGVILSVHTSVGTGPIVKYGTKEQKHAYVTDLARGKKIGAFALTEPGAGSDAASLKTSAVDRGDHYVLNGSKAFITNAGAAGVYIVFARTGEEPGNRGISAFIVDADSQGLIVGKKEEKMGMHGTNTSELIFENMIVPKENLLGALNDGYRVALANLNAGRIGIAAQALGIAEGALQRAVRYANERKQFGASIARNQGISFKLAEMATEVEAAKCLVYQAAHLEQSGVPCVKEASIAKLIASKAAVEVSQQAVQVFGGYGYTKEYEIERYFRDAKVCEIYEGTSEIQKMVISKQLMNKG